MVEAMTFLAEEMKYGTNAVSLHPVVTLYLSKLASLNNSDCLCSDCMNHFSVAYAECRKLAETTSSEVAR